MRLYTITVLVLVAALSGRVEAQPSNSTNWTTKQVANQVLLTGLLAVDYGQTSHIAQSCAVGGRYYEKNPVLGRCPSQARVRNYFALYGVALAVAAHKLPAKYREIAQGLIINHQADTVSSNYSIGLKIKF